MKQCMSSIQVSKQLCEVHKHLKQHLSEIQAFEAVYI